LYPETLVSLSGNTVINPVTPIPGATRIRVSTVTDFKGLLNVDPVSGSVRVTNAYPGSENYPGGVFPVTVSISGPGGTAEHTFGLRVNTGSACVGGPEFVPPTVSLIAVANVPHSIAVGDVNGDGRQDFLATSLDEMVSIRLGDGLGGFTAPAVAEVPVENEPVSIAIADFNGDGRQDFVTTNRFGDSLSIRLGDGSGGFSSPSTPDILHFSPFGIAVADFNRDGNADLVIGSVDGSVNLQLRSGDGAGAFAFSSLIRTGTNPRSPTVGDFNGDGNVDLATVNFNDDNVSVRLGDVAGNFSSPTVPEVAVGDEPIEMAQADLNGDGRQDLIVANFRLRTVSVRLGDGSGGFSAPAVGEVDILAPTLDLEHGDFDRDRKEDILIASDDTGVSVRRGDGLGGLVTPATGTLAVGKARAVAVGDFNGDGIQDFAATSVFDDAVAIRLGTCAVVPVSISGRVLTPLGTGIRNAVVRLTDSLGGRRLAVTSSFGNYEFAGIPAGSYTLSVSSRRYRFAPRLLDANTNLVGVDVIGLE